MCNEGYGMYKDGDAYKCKPNDIDKCTKVKTSDNELSNIICIECETENHILTLNNTQCTLKSIPNCPTENIQKAKCTQCHDDYILNEDSTICVLKTELPGC